MMRKGVIIILGLSVLTSFISCNDDKVVPDFLDFEEVAILEAWNVHNAAGFLASEELNSLFIASRESNPENGGLVGERILRYNVSDGTTDADYTVVEDFVTKEIHIQGDSITVIGGQFINTYGIDFDQPSQSIAHGLALTRFGSTIYKDELYVWGGDINNVDSDKIRRWNRATNSFENIRTMPAKKDGAHGEVIDDKLYIFGGQEQWQFAPPNDLIVIYNFRDNSVETSRLPQPVFRTFTDVHQGRIYIAGQLADNDPATSDLDIFFAVFNPEDNSVKEIETSLNDNNFRTIHQMAILKDNIYILYGDVNANRGEIQLMKYEL